MFVIKPNNKNFTFLRTNRDTRFRLEDLFLGKRNNLVFLNNSLNNPFYEYQIISIPVEGGTYNFKIKSLDDLFNINNGQEEAVVLSDILWRPIDFVISSIDGNDVTFTWSPPEGGSTPLGYKIYGNDGSGHLINRVTSLGTVSYGTNTVEITVADGNWLFVIESYDASYETLNYYSVFHTIPVEDAVPQIPNEPGDDTIFEIQPEYQMHNVQLRNVSVGKCGISFIWLQGNDASHFRIYHNNGSGSVDFVTYAFRYARQNSWYQEFVTDQLETADENVEWKFGIRAESPNGVVDSNEVEYTVELDGEAPDEVESMTAEVY